MNSNTSNTFNKCLDKLPLRILYIMGAGRSGSTVLDTVLGNHSEIESVGELTNLPRSGWINDEYCACGKRGTDCPFWSDVRREWVRRTGVDDPKGYLALQSTFERFRRWPRLLKERRRPSPQFQIYAEQTRALFEAVRTVSGKSIIVDSSKNPTRAFALSMLPNVDLYLIHLIRDGRGVIWSYLKAHRKDEKNGVQRDLAPVPAWRTSINWRLVNSTSEFVLKQKIADGACIRYEDFVQQPVKTLNRIGDMLSISLDSVADNLVCGREVTVGHTIAGNRVRMSGAITLRPDYEWKELLPGKDRKIFWLLAGTVARRYGYDKV
ncbi:sulfotransferase [Desulfolucanica intricata]|uniref:sulfotransferase n=1 Tax=Desulfolucanica intricata TaxID=1285191 RepID=UPI00082A612C|nr:sulfotransferase [Desulfolucanica intricata]